MPKRFRSNFSDQSHNSNVMKPANKRLSLPRGCKRPVKRKKTLAEIFELSYERSKIDSKHQDSKNLKTLNKVMEKVDNMSGDQDDLDVVFDLKEEKKNKVYEVINVASDDESPNQVTYERLYADNPEDKIVIDKPKDFDVSIASAKPAQTAQDTIDLFNCKDDFSLNDLVCEIVNETLVKDKEVEISMKEGSSTESLPANDSTINTKNDSDDDIVCIAVIDAKTIAEQKKANIEEICLSSDSETEEIKPLVPPIRLKIPGTLPKTGIYNTHFPESSNFSSASLFPYMFPKDTHYSSPFFNWDSSSSSSPKVVSTHFNEESCSSFITNNDQQPISFKKIYRPSTYPPCSPSSTSSEEDTTVYWQGKPLSHVYIRYIQC